MWPIFNVKIFCKHISVDIQRHRFLPVGAPHLSLLKHQTLYFIPFCALWIGFYSLSCIDNEWMLTEFSKLNEFRCQLVKRIIISIWVTFISLGFVLGLWPFILLPVFTYCIILSHAYGPILLWNGSFYWIKTAQQCNLISVCFFIFSIFIAWKVVRGFKHGGTLNTDLWLSEIFRIKMTFKSCKEKQNLINVNCLLRTSD